MDKPKPSEDDKQFFLGLIPDGPAVEVKPMFGNLGAFVHGNMFAGLFGPAVGVPLDETGQGELAAMEASAPFAPAERPMRGYISLPEAWRAHPDPAAVCVAKALTHAGLLPASLIDPN